jgi:soluble lytic murein transglycosylase-like protein
MKKNIFFITLLFSSLAYADVYKFVDPSGRVFYTDQKQNKAYKKIHILSPYRKKLSESYKRTLVEQYYASNSASSFSLHSPYKSIASHSPYRFRNRSYGDYPTIYGRYSAPSPNKSRFSSMIADAAFRHHVDERLVHAVIQTESAYNPSAVSSAGAVGLMQLMPGTARRYGVMNRNDPVQNIDGGTKYLKDLLSMFDYNLDLAIAAYNAGEGAVMKYNNSIPPYPETQNYVRQVMARYGKSM